MAVFVVFNLWIGPILFLSHVINFRFFNSDFLVTTLGLNPFSGTYLNKLQFLRCSLIRLAQSEGSTGLGASFPENRNRASCKT